MAGSLLFIEVVSRIIIKNDNEKKDFIPLIYKCIRTIEKKDKNQQFHFISNMYTFNIYLNIYRLFLVENSRVC